MHNQRVILWITLQPLFEVFCHVSASRWAVSYTLMISTRHYLLIRSIKLLFYIKNTYHPKNLINIRYTPDIRSISLINLLSNIYSNKSSVTEYHNFP